MSQQFKNFICLFQANWTDWAHLVSTDLAHWTRIESALSPNGDWDGSVTLIDGKPVILYDCFNVADCRPPPPPAAAAPLVSSRWGEGSGDPAIVGVARPVNYDDPDLAKWQKDARNPIVIHGGGR